MKTYKSKLGKGLLSFMVGCLIFSIFPIILTRDWVGILIASFICLGVFLFFIFLYLNTKYVIDGNQLIIYNGGLNKFNIDIGSITSIEEVINYVSAPAFSTHRLKIIYKNRKCTYISPIDLDLFLADIRKLNSKIEVKRKL